MSELDPVTFLIATELLAGSDATSPYRRMGITHPGAVGSPTLILLADGAGDDRSDVEPGWRDSFENLCLRGQRDFGTDSIRIAYLRSTKPTLSDVVEDLLSRRIHQFRILPLMLSDWKLMAYDVSEEIRILEEKYAALEIVLLPAIGEDVRFQRLLWQVVRESVLPEWLAKTS